MTIESFDVISFTFCDCLRDKISMFMAFRGLKVSID